MFVSRYWRQYTLVNSLLRISRSNVNLGAIHLSEHLYLLEFIATHNKFKCNSYVTFAEFKCWNCQTLLDSTPCLFCKNCNLIQSSDQQNFNYFELLNIPNQYDIDTGQLTSNFRKLQNVIHPDKFSNKTKVNYL